MTFSEAFGASVARFSAALKQVLDVTIGFVFLFLQQNK